MKKYISPKIIIIKIDNSDLICSSDNPYWKDENKDTKEQGGNPYWSGGWGNNSPSYRNNIWD